MKRERRSRRGLWRDLFHADHKLSDVAILGTGKISDKPWVTGGQVAIRKVLPLSLTFDHRVNDGAGAAKFLTWLVAYLEDPAAIFIESA